MSNSTLLSVRFSGYVLLTCVSYERVVRGHLERTEILRGLTTTCIKPMCNALAARSAGRHAGIIIGRQYVAYEPRCRLSRIESCYTDESVPNVEYNVEYQTRDLQGSRM